MKGRRVRPRRPGEAGPAATRGGAALRALRACGIAAVIGLAAAGGTPEPVLDALFAGARVTKPLAELMARPSLAAGENFRVEELGRDANSSHHLVWIRDRETPHRHDRHDLFVVMLRGYGGMRLGTEERPAGPGSIFYVPRGTVHAFRNGSGEPAAAYAVYAPPFDGTDRVEVE